MLKYVGRSGELLIACEMAISPLDDAKAFRQIQYERGLVANKNLSRQASVAGVDGVPQKVSPDTTTRNQRIYIKPRKLAIGISDKAIWSTVCLGDHQLACEQPLAIGSLGKRKNAASRRAARSSYSRAAS